MADDAHRDLLPVTESSCIDTCRSNILDSRERHAVCKLDRYQLEDRYLRLRDEVHRLKKLSNSQEDKIKRLGTKLMRVAATPRSCLATALDFNNDKNRVDSLELENAKLKDKITVLRNQILNHTIVGRSPSRNRRLQICNSSGPTTCRSETGRRKNSSSQLLNVRDEQTDSQTFIAKIEDLEMQKNEMTSRIADLESQLADNKIGNQREKAAENVEYIRVWRQMNLQKEQLVLAQAANVSMSAQIRDLNALLEEKTKNNKEITTALLAEKKKLADIEEQLGRAKDSQSALREKEEQIKDLTSEMKILHQHNAELLALSSKCSQVELENVDLKKKISEQLSDNQSLKNAFVNEQTNFNALQAANEQLMTKLQDLQKNIDALTIQLKSFQSQNERQEKSRSEHEKVKTVDRQTSTVSLDEKVVASSEQDAVRGSETCKNCCKASRERVPTSPMKNLTDREVQTENDLPEKLRDPRSEINHKESPIRVVQRSPVRDLPTEPDNGSGSLTPNEMLKILEQAQINTPLEMQDAARIRQIASTSSTKYANSVEPGERQSSFRVTEKLYKSKFNNDPWKILMIMYRVLREFVDTTPPSSIAGEPDPSPSASSRAPVDPAGIDLRQNNIHYSNTRVNGDPFVGQSVSSFLDENNNRISAKIDNDEKRESAKNIIIQNEEESNYEFGETQPLPDQLSSEILKNENVESRSEKNLKNRASRSIYRSDEFTETSDCTCNENRTCSEKEDCGYACAQKISKIEDLSLENGYLHCQCDAALSAFKNVRSIRVKGTDGSHESLRRPHDATKFLSETSWQPKTVVCRKANCADEVASRRIAPYPMLVTDDQGLLEIHIVRLKLSSAASGILCAEERIDELTLFVSWDVWNQRTAFTPFLVYPRYDFNTSSIYRLTELFEFFERALVRSVPFRIHVSRPDKNGSYAVAEANLSLKDIVDYPGKKLHYVKSFTSILPRSYGADFGQLSLWIRLSCDRDRVKSFKKRTGGSSAGHPASKKLESLDRQSDGKIFHELSSESGSIRQSVSSGSHESIRKSPVDTERSDKEPSESSQIDDKISLKAREPSRQSKDSETPSLTRERSLLNGAPINDTSRRVPSTSDSYITISPSPALRSDSSNIKAMEDEDATSSDFRSGKKKHDTGAPSTMALEEETRTKDGDGAKLETASVNEFNDFLRNGINQSSRESSSSVQDLSSVINDNDWSEYKRRSLASQARSRKPSVQTPDAETESGISYPISDRSTSNNDAVVLRIESISLFPRCSVLEDPGIHQLYVEFSFLGYRGVDLETISVPKPTGDSSALFNYMRHKKTTAAAVKNRGENSFNYNWMQAAEFEIDKEKHPIQRSIMRAMMTDNDNPTIKFTVVSEPLPDEEETKECADVGYAYFNIRDHILNRRFREVALPIMNVDRTEPIGTLKITLLGANAIRRCMSDT